jgi:uncharacterized membrane protein
MASRNQSTQSLRSEDIMKASAWLFSAAICVSSLALAQTAPQSRVTESTDPAKAAEVERHAQELAARAQTTPTMEERNQMKKQSTHPSKSKSKHKRAKKDKAPSDTPMAPESKG